MFKKILFVGVLFSALTSAYAMTPTLSLSKTGSADGVLMTVSGDPNSPVSFSYYSTVSSGLQSLVVGNTSSSGGFWTVLNTSAYNISSNGSVYVTVNSQQSPTNTWPYTTTTSSNGTLSLSQTGIVLSPGQTTSITATNAASMYLFNNTNPSVVNVSISGSQINISANTNGSTIFTVCSGTASNCVSVYVTVQNSGTQLLTFSQSNAVVTVGQTLPISIYGGSGSYTVTSNSNGGVIQASLSGSTLNLYGNSGTGQSSVTICTTDMASCGIVNATIGTTSSSPLTFSQTNPTLSAGQTSLISVSGSSGTYSISSNSNPSSVQASVSGSSLSLYGSSYGTSNIMVCSSLGSCSSLMVTVSSAGGGGSLTLSQTNLVLVTGQTVGVTISGGTVPYSVSNTSNGIVQSNLNNNIVTLTGVGAGNTSVNICSAGGGCAAISVLVNTSAGGTTALSPGFSQSSVSLTIGQSSIVNITGGSSYYLGSNSNPTVASPIISGSTVTITGNANGSTILTICQSTSQCNTINVSVGTTLTTINSLGFSPVVPAGQKMTFTVSGGNGSYYLSSPSTSAFLATLTGNTLSIRGLLVGSSQLTICSSDNICSSLFVTITNSATTETATPIIIPTTNTTVSSKYLFNTPLKFGAKGLEVIELQKRLHAEGFFSGQYVATYGDATVAAVKKYQKAHKLSQLGNLGPATRDALNN